jgi:2-keto-4-pentenoate hydratase
MNAASLEEAARRVRRAAEERTPCEPIRDLIPEGDVAAAYAVQEINTKLGLQRQRRLVGRKIGLTSAVVQEQLGVDQPDYGMLFADMGVKSGEKVAIDRLLQPKVEAEIAFVLREDLDAEKLSEADLVDAIDYALPAIEIVDSRIANWDISITDTVADNASSGLFVLGESPRQLSEIDLEGCEMVMRRHGEVVSNGVGAACLGNPLIATRWLADTMAKAGRPLRSGDIVLSGALGPMVTVQPGDEYSVSISGLGNVSTVFSRSQDKAYT